MSGVTWASLPFQEAIEFHKAKSLVPSDHWYDLDRDAHDAGFMVAGARKADLLEQLHAGIIKALTQGTTLEEFRKDFDAAASKHGWGYVGDRDWRSEIIYTTNLRMAYAAGRFKQMTTPDMLRLRPYWIYRIGNSLEHRPLHASWDGIVLPANHPWFQTHYAPNGWGCRCRVVSLSRAEVRWRGLKVLDHPPDDGTITWVNPATKSPRQVPRGIDPGFDYTPGRSLLEGAARMVTQKLERWPEPLSQAVVNDMVGAEVFRHWLEKPRGNFPVVVLPDEIKDAIHSTSRVVVLSPDTMAKQARQHPEITPEEYALLPQMPRESLVIRLDGRKVVLFKVLGRIYKAVVKTTEHGDEVYLVSFYRADDREIERDLRRGEVLFGGEGFGAHGGAPH